MKKALIYWVLVLIIAMAMTGCGSPKVTAYTESGKTITTSADQEFTISLQANPTTGYDWKTSSFDTNLISLVKKDYNQDDHTGKPLVGSGGTDFFTFKALKAGEAKITFIYYRPWEAPKPEDQRQVFTVVIK